MATEDDRRVREQFGVDSLKGAIPANWPFWCDEEGRVVDHWHPSDIDEAWKQGRLVARMPDFPNDPAASLRLAEQMNKDSGPCMFFETPYWEDGKGHGFGVYAGAIDREDLLGEADTFGQALLNALEAADSPTQEAP